MYIAQTVQSVANGTHPLLSVILDRSECVDMAFIKRVMSLGQFSWHGRRPMASIDKDGNERTTDLDLLSVLVELQRRRARIELPGYDNQLPWKVTANEQHVGTKRYGPIVQLISHQEHLSFSVRIFDESIVRTEGDVTRGAERSYMMVNHDGEWHAGWKGLTWEHTVDEQRFFDKRHILPQDGQLRFKYYVHPNRRQSFFAQAYLLMKLLLRKLNEEIDFYADQLRRLRQAGVTVPEDCKAKERPILARGDTRNEFRRRFWVHLQGLDFVGNFPLVTQDEAGYRQAFRRHKELLEELRPTLQFMVRADEVAFYLYGYKQGFTPWWIEGPEWSRTSSGSHKIELCGRLALECHSDEVPVEVAAD